MGDLYKECSYCLCIKNIYDFYPGRNQCKSCLHKKQVEYQNNRYQTDSQYKFRKSISNNIRNSLMGNKSYISVQYLGCSIDKLERWIEYQFNENMSWDNYGSYWEIDHVLPVSKFDLTNEQNIYQCFNWRNLQPLEARENIRKSNKIILNMINNQILKAKKFENEYVKETEIVNNYLQWLDQGLVFIPPSSI